MTILLSINGFPQEEWLQAVRKSLPDEDVHLVQDFSGDPASVEYLLAWKASPGTLGGYPNVKAVFSLGAGVDHLANRPDMPQGVPVARVVDDALTARMTEWITLQVLLHHRQHMEYMFQQQSAQWNQRAQWGSENVSVGIMGMGVLGQASAEVLVKLGFDIAGWSRTPKDMAGIKGFHGHDQLDRFLSHTDILVVLLPNTPETNGILNRRLFQKLKKDGPLGGPVLINAGRGPLQNEADIIACLEDGTLKAVSLDVFEKEPLASDSPLWSHPNAIIYPHVAAVTDPNRVAQTIAKQIQNHREGKPLQNTVDLSCGY
jgi:glyoxylate/hydroxypyruvate reductase A